MKQYIPLLIGVTLFLISFFSFLHFFENDQHMLYGDSLSRMNISRKIIDNLTPGFAQLGNVWLPLPQLLMLPLISNEFLWRSGIGGAIISMLAYIIAGLYIFKTSRLVTNSVASSVVAVSVFSLNINLIYLQVTAMSESLYLCALTASIYYFCKWIKYSDPFHLIPAAISVSAITLIRYEALSVLLASVPMVFLYTLIKTRKYYKAESNTLVYGALAGFGFSLWTIYLAAIFGDPLYWKNYYTSTHVVGDDKTQLHVFTFHLNHLQAFWKYFTSVVWMNGLIPTILAIIGVPVLLVKSIREKSYYFLPILLSLSMYAFMILTLKRNTPIDQPELNFANILSPATSDFDEFNIRYGLLMLPLIALLCSYVFNIRFTIIKMIVVLLLSIQFYTYFDPQFTVIYQFPLSIHDNITQGTPKEKAMVKWMQSNYDDGLIMISALKHDPQMLQMGLKYKYYIHEGAGRYWKESTKDPQRYAKWVIFDSYNKDDQVTKFLKDSQALTLFYDLVYNNDGMLVYKIKTQTDVPYESLIH